MHHPTDAVPSDNKANLRMHIREHRLAVCILNIVFNPRKHKFLKLNKLLIFTTCTCFHPRLGFYSY